MTQMHFVSDNVPNFNLLRPMDALAEGRSLAPESLWRRYSEFELLRNYLIVTYPYIVAPPLPEKRVSSLSMSFLCSRTKENTAV